MNLAEVYRILYVGPEDNFHGIIQSADPESGLQTLFKSVDIEDTGLFPALFRAFGSESDVKKLEIIGQQFYTFDVKLQGPNIASISANFDLHFVLFGYLNTYMTYPRRDELARFCTPLFTELRTDDGSRCITVLYAVFENAAEACVKVKWTTVKTGFYLKGSISARTSAIKNSLCKSMLFFNDNGDLPVKAGAETYIPLSKSLVAVPVGSDLILDICLSGGDNNNKMVPNAVVFKCVQGLPSSYRMISCSNWEILVEILWRYEDKCMEMEARDVQSE